MNKSNIVRTSGAVQKKDQGWKDRLHPEDYEKLRETFAIFDEDGSGTIDPVEINKILEELGTANRNPFVISVIEALKSKNKQINF